MNGTLIIGYGNIDRQDDGVAWHILCQIAEINGLSDFCSGQESFREDSKLHLLFDLQLTPDLAEVIANYDRVCFVDAHTGNIENDISFSYIIPEYKPSAFTHHMSPETCLSLVKTIYKREPEAVLASVRGYDFEFGDGLSSKTAELADLCAKKINAWICQSDQVNLDTGLFKS